MAEGSKLSVLTKGIVKENPTLRLVLGTCPTLAITTAAINGIGMGVAATLVLVGSNIAVSLLRNVIPDKVRIPAFITIIATFVTVIQMLVKAFTPAIDSALGIYLPLIVVNCIILARAEMFASKNKVLPSILDALGMGIGFTAALTLMGIIREVLGAGTLFGLPVTSPFIDPMVVFILPPGGFFVFGVLVALANKLAVRMGKKPVTKLGCGGCSGCEGCGSSGKCPEAVKEEVTPEETVSGVDETAKETETPLSGDTSDTLQEEDILPFAPETGKAHTEPEKSEKLKESQEPETEETIENAVTDSESEVKKDE